MTLGTLVNKLETIVAGWLRNVPHLPAAGQRWLGENIWWIALICAIATGIGALFTIGDLFSGIALLSAINTYYYAVGGLTGWVVVTALVSLAFTLASGLLLALAVNPLKAGQKQGWRLLFLSWLVNALSIVVGSILTLSVFGFILGIIFGAIGLAISGYFLFEIHGQFVRSGRKGTTKKA